MRRLIHAGTMIATLMSSSVAMAIPNPDTGPGCGLGKKLWSGSPNQKNILPQAFMATTNVTGFQTFAISSGTSGCSNDGVLWAEKKTEAFVVANYDDLLQEMAQGRGEHLASLATLIGVEDQNALEFSAWVQQEYQRLIGSDESGPVELLHSLHKSFPQRPS